MIFCLSSENLFSSLCISLSYLLVTISEIFFCKIFEIFAILSANLLPLKSIVASAISWVSPLESVLSASLADYLVWSRSFELYL